MREWSHLPNAVHIDAILHSAFTYPSYWSVPSHNQQSRMQFTQMSAESRRNQWCQLAADAISDAAWDAAVHHNDASSIKQRACWRNARYAAMALVLYENCSYLLNMPSEQVRVLAGIALPAAILLLPAVVAFESIKELSYA